MIPVEFIISIFSNHETYVLMVFGGFGYYIAKKLKFLTEKVTRLEFILIGDEGKNGIRKRLEEEERRSRSFYRKFNRLANALHRHKIEIDLEDT